MKRLSYDDRRSFYSDTYEADTRPDAPAIPLGADDPTDEVPPMTLAEAVDDDASRAAAVAAYWNDPEFGARRRRAALRNYACQWCGSVMAHCADRECPGAQADGAA